MVRSSSFIVNTERYTLITRTHSDDCRDGFIYFIEMSPLRYRKDILWFGMTGFSEFRQIPAPNAPF